MSESKRLMLLAGRLCLVLIIILEVSYAIRGIASIALERWAIALGIAVTLVYWLLTDTPQRRSDEASEPQKRVLRTMLEFECPVYLSLDFYEPSFGHCWFGEQGLFAYSTNVVNRSTVLSLLNRGLVVERRRLGKPPNWTTVFSLTRKGREVAKELQDDETE